MLKQTKTANTIINKHFPYGDPKRMKIKPQKDKHQKKE